MLDVDCRSSRWMVVVYWCLDTTRARAHAHAYMIDRSPTMLSSSRVLFNDTVFKFKIWDTSGHDHILFR